MKYQSDRGYTIIEVMIVLLVSAGLFAAVYATFNLQTHRRQFTEGVRTVEKNLLDVLNDTANGYYPSAGNFSCVSSASGVTLSSAPISPANREQGAKENCVFIGKAVQFNPRPGAAPQLDRFNVYTLAARRLTTTATSNGYIADTTQTLGGTNRVAVATEPVAGGSGARVVDTRYFNAGYINVYRIVDLSNDSTMGGFVILNGVGSVTPRGAKSGTISTSIVPLSGSSWGGAAVRSTLGNPDSDFIGKVTNLTTPASLSTSKGVLICLREEGGTRRASIEIGRENQTVSTVTKFDRAVDTVRCP